jgi:ribosomal protein L11 methyltransferase
VLLLHVPAGIADELVGRLAASILGAALEPREQGLTGVRVFLRSPRGIAEALARTREVLAEFDLDPEACDLRTEYIEDDRWAERYQASLRPLPLGSRFVVDPSGAVAAEALNGARDPILLTPGRAFGTGEHATTRLCVDGLERHVRPGSRWLDLGCGTSILSIVAFRCGAGEVLAVDQDAEAVAVAREVLEANGLAGRIEVREGSIDQAAGGVPWDGIVSNIHAPFFLERPREIAAGLAPDGLLIASGFLSEDVDAIATALAGAGVVQEEQAVEEPWAVWVGRRRAET